MSKVVAYTFNTICKSKRPREFPEPVKLVGCQMRRNPDLFEKVLQQFFCFFFDFLANKRKSFPLNQSCRIIYSDEHFNKKRPREFPEPVKLVGCQMRRNLDLFEKVLQQFFCFFFDFLSGKKKVFLPFWGSCRIIYSDEHFNKKRPREFPEPVKLVGCQMRRNLDLFEKVLQQFFCFFFDFLSGKKKVFLPFWGSCRIIYSDEHFNKKRPREFPEPVKLVGCQMRRNLDLFEKVFQQFLCFFFDFLSGFIFFLIDFALNFILFTFDLS